VKRLYLNTFNGDLLRYYHTLNAIDPSKTVGYSGSYASLYNYSLLGLYNNTINSEITLKTDYVGKIANSTIENPNTLRRRSTTTLGDPTTSVGWTDGAQVYIDPLSALDGVLGTGIINSNGLMSVMGYGFDLINVIERKVGKGVWNGKTLLADKITILNTIIKSISCNWYGYGTGSGGNYSKLGWWTGAGYTFSSGSSWEHVNGTVTKINPVCIFGSTGWWNTSITNDGFVHIVANPNPSNGTIASTINHDYVNLEITFKKTSDLIKI
jgi:hypothetical protein